MLIGKQLTISVLLQSLLVCVFLDIGHLRTFWAISFFMVSLIVYVLQPRRFTNEEWTDRWLVGSLWLGLVLFVGISPLALQDHDMVGRILQVFSLIALLFGGMLAMKSQMLTLVHVRNTLYVSFVLMMGISLIATMIQYGPWYRFLYPTGVMYIDGEQYRLANEFLMFQGWGFITTRIGWLDGWILVGFTPFFHWIFNRKQQPFTYWIPTVLSGLFIVGLPYGQPLYYVGLCCFVILVWWGIQKLQKSLQQLIGWGITTVVLIGVFLGLADAFNWFSLSETIRSISLFNRVYNVAFVDRYQAIIVFVSQSIFGNYGQLIVFNQYVEATGSLVFDIAYQAGWLSLFSFFGLVILNGHWWKINPSMKADDKRWIGWMLVLMFAPWILNYVLFPYVREQNEWYPQLFLEHPLFLMSIIISSQWVMDPFSLFKKR